ncbi:MAG: 1-deoxy-D-xylulose-5-phosphate reductoisomerase [Alistipes sp.]|nr:1-deoxy-D-xylulose-5-phosphate reductoisomerase [Alistipes sp.]
MPQKLAILGSTGSIGVQTLDIVRSHPEQFEVVTLTAHRNWQLLAQQAREFDADSAVIADESLYPQLKEALAHTDIKVYAGSEAVVQAVENSTVDTVVNALVGYAGMMPTLKAVQHGKKVALANKESLVTAGELIMKTALENNAPILPVDSEHSAIFQSLAGECSPLKRIIITCSGGAFRNVPREELAAKTVEEALRHPQWNMGAKITVDSATLVNKGFEVIEARWLFDTPADRIDVIIHPQSIIHSLVEFEDGALKAQLGLPDMHIPISYALTYPYREPFDTTARFSFLDHPELTFEPADREKFPALDIAYDCLRRGGSAACTMNGANDVAVDAFLRHRCAYPHIVGAIEYALGNADFTPAPAAEDLALANQQARRLATEYLQSKQTQWKHS